MSSVVSNASATLNFTTPTTLTASTALNGANRALHNSPTSLRPFNDTEKSITELFYNGTGYYIDDEVEPGLNDLQTLFLACFATLIPLVISVFTAFGIRILWRKYKRRRRDRAKYDGMLHREGTSESIGKPLHSHLLNSDKQCGDTQLAISTEDVEVCEGAGVNSGQIRNSNHSSTNGSIITMTLKNNHLIVETEERNDIEEDSRETTMKYSPGARDGVFVVEVQQGSRRSPGSGGGPVLCADAETSISVSDQCALVHNPPDRYSDEETLEETDDNDYYAETTSSTRETPDSIIHQAKTGLTQSNTSLSSIQHSYCYSNQQGYDNGVYGYPIYNGYVNEEPNRCLPNANKPKIMSAVYKHPLNASIDVPCNDLLLSDLKAAEKAERKVSNAEGQPEHISSGKGSSNKLHNDISKDAGALKTSKQEIRSAEYGNGGLPVQ